MVTAALTALALGTASAQQQRLPNPDDVSAAVGVNFNNLQLALQNTLNAYKGLWQENESLKKHISDLEDYLKKCGDKPGCTLPVPEKR